MAELAFLPSGAHAGWLVERQVILDMLVPFNHVEHTEQVLLGVEWNDLRASCDNCFLPFANTTPFLRLGVIHDSRQRYGYGISSVDGQRISLTHEYSLPGWGRPLDGTATALDWRGAHALSGRHQVLSAQLSGAFSTSDALLVAGGKQQFTEDAFDREFSLRGYPSRSFAGDRFMRATVSYRFPLSYPEKGFGTVPLFVEKFHGNLFVEGARMRATSWDPALSTGAEIGTDLAVGYAVPLTLRLGIARGAGDLGETRVYLRVEGSVLP